MKEHTKHQIIKGPDGSPAFVVIPYDEYIEEFGSEAKTDEEVTIPHAVVKLNIVNGYSLIRAWREYLGLTQAEAAKRIGTSQPGFAQIEAPDANPRTSTLIKIAEAFGIDLEQLQEE